MFWTSAYFCKRNIKHGSTAQLLFACNRGNYLGNIPCKTFTCRMPNVHRGDMLKMPYCIQTSEQNKVRCCYSLHILPHPRMQSTPAYRSSLTQTCRVGLVVVLDRGRITFPPQTNSSRVCLGPDQVLLLSGSWCGRLGPHSSVITVINQPKELHQGVK